MNMIHLDTVMLDAPIEGSTPEEREDVEIIDTLTRATPEQWVMEIILDPRIKESDS